jgi:hypothetical protein
MGTSDCINPLTAFPQPATRNRRRYSGKGCFLNERPNSIESLAHPEVVSFFVEPTRIFVSIANSLGISSIFCYVMAKTPSKPFLMEDLSCRLSIWTTEEQGVLKRIEQSLPEEQLAALARQTGAMQRQRKINPRSLLGALCLATLRGSCSLNMVAMFMGLLAGCTVSKQALSQRINECWVRVFRNILGCTLVKTALSAEVKSTGIFSFFKRVLINDSTKLALPKKLASYFPGSCNQTKKQNAMISLQATLDLLSETFVYFHVAPFTYNDQRAAPDILQIISAGDLIIRDLGYFVPRVFGAIIDKGAYFLSRYHHSTDLGDVHGNKIDLLDALKKSPLLDMRLYLGKQARVPVRLVAIPVTNEVANERRRKLHKNKNRDRRLNPTKEHLALCGWQIFVTNVTEIVWTPQDVSNAYGLRWRIEVIFKAWKSHFNIANFTNGSKEYVQMLIYVRLIFIILFQVTFVRFDKWIDHNARGTHLSLLKFAQFFAVFLAMAFGSAIMNTDTLHNQILKHCVYEPRTKRISYGKTKQSLLS